jgi:hypothetical protein
MKNFAYPVLGNPLYRPDALWNFHSANTEFDIISKKQTTKTTGGLTRTYSKYGSGVVVNGTANFDRYVLNSDAGNIGADNWTGLIQFTLDAIGVTYSAIGSWEDNDTSTNDKWFIGGDFNAANSAWFVVCIGTTGYSVNVACSWVAGHTYTALARREGTTITLDLYDHDTRTTVSGSTTNAGITTININANNITLGESGKNQGSLTQNTSLTAYKVAFFKRALNNFEVNELLVNTSLLFEQEEIENSLQNVTTLAISPAHFYITGPAINVQVLRSLAISPAHFYITVNDHEPLSSIVHRDDAPIVEKRASGGWIRPYFGEPVTHKAEVELLDEKPNKVKKQVKVQDILEPFEAQQQRILEQQQLNELKRKKFIMLARAALLS